MKCLFTDLCHTVPLTVTARRDLCVIFVKFFDCHARFWKFCVYICRSIHQIEAMKRLKETIIMMLAVCLFAACDSEGGKDVIWDITPVEFNIFVTDSQGNDLLDSTRQNNVIKDISVSYNGETYSVMTEQDYYEKQFGKAQTRYYMPHFYGLILHQYWSHKSYSSGDFELLFGEFDGTENIEKREVVLNIPGARQAILSYKNSFRWKSDGSPQKSTIFYLNGQELKDEAGKCGIYHFQYSDSQGLKYIPGEIL